MRVGKILVIDDEKIVCSGFKKELEKNGYAVDVAYGEQEAIDKIKSKKYDLAYIDYVLPETNGAKICRQIKKLSPETEAVFMTGNCEHNVLKSEIEFLKAGGRTFSLYKPFYEGELIEVTKKVLN